MAGYGLKDSKWVEGFEMGGWGLKTGSWELKTGGWGQKRVVGGKNGQWGVGNEHLGVRLEGGNGQLGWKWAVGVRNEWLVAKTGSGGWKRAFGGSVGLETGSWGRKQVVEG